MGLYDQRALLLWGYNRVHKYTDKYRSLACFSYLSMLIYLVLGYKKCKKCSMGIYLEGLILGVRIKLRNECSSLALFWGFYGIL